MAAILPKTSRCDAVHRMVEEVYHSSVSNTLPNAQVNPRMPRERRAKYQPDPPAAYVGLNRLILIMAPWNWGRLS
jgi:hypothetical protein